MFSGFLLISALLSTSSGQSQQPGPPQKVQALAGEDVVLPCSFNVTRSPDPQTVEWSKDGPKPNIVFLLRDGCETHEEKNPAFEHRTSLFMKKLKEGNISLRISDIHPSDAGTYTCKTLFDNPPYEVKLLELVVGQSSQVAASDLKLSVVSPEHDGVTLQCEANGVYLQDDHGNNISAGVHGEDEDVVKRRKTLKAAATRFTCTAQHSNQPSSAKTLIPAICSKIIAAVAAVMFLLGGVVVGLALFFWTRSKNTKNSTTQQESGEGEKLLLCPMTEDQTDTTRELASPSPETKISMNDSSALSGSSPPKAAGPPENKPRWVFQRYNSIPKCSRPIQESHQTASSTSGTTRLYLNRSFSDPQTSQPGPDPVKSECRLSSVLPSAFPPYSHLRDLKEDTE